MATTKKTAEVDYSMYEKIMALYELQKIDSQIDEINKVKGELPDEVQDLDDEIAGLRTRVEGINAEIEELGALTRQRRRQIDEANMLIAKYNEQQANVRNNREFDAIAKEIEYQELEIRLAEKHLREYAAAVKAKKKIDNRLLTAYERIRSKVRNGLAVVTVQRDACSGCFNRIPPQRQVEVSLGKKLIVCEYCGRILVPSEE